MKDYKITMVARVQAEDLEQALMEGSLALFNAGEDMGMDKVTNAGEIKVIKGSNWVTTIEEE